MLFRTNPISSFAVAIICIFYLSAQAEFTPNRIVKVRTKTSLNAGWKFFKNDPADTANAYKSSYNDVSWQTVNVPHSAMYVAPDEVAEKCTTPSSVTWSGFCWYRKAFSVSQTGPKQKFFLEFEGAMSTAQVWLNGTFVGTHDAGGFTGFSFDVSNLINPSGTNVLTLRLDCNYRWDVPPGNAPSTNPNTGRAQGEYPDFMLFSGLCRNVWLVASNNVYIPLYEQKVTTPMVSATRATVRVQTMVRNANSLPKVCTVQFAVADASGMVVAQKTQTQTVGAGSSVTFDQTTDSLVNPKLWSPETPNLYRVFTKVTTDSQVVDDNVERFGIRSIAWSATSGFSLNGQQYVEKGVCMHQEFAWVGQALSASRYYQEALLAKKAGFNAIRCAHYPRPPAFYDACDELGLLCEPETPFWGGSMSYYPPLFWSRLDTAAAEMVRVGRNHPSIIQWGIANEPAGGFDAQFTEECTTIKRNDSTRFTAMINNKSATENVVADIMGVNYNTSYSPINKGLYTAEYHQGWMYFCHRGDTVSKNGRGTMLLPPAGFFVHTDTNCYGGGTGCVSESEDAFTECYSSTASGRGWMNIQGATGPGKPLAGGHLWVLVDYNSDCNVGTHPMGILDQYRIPKKAYYSYQTNWTTTPSDYPTKGLTATSLRLEADVTNLVADSTDLSRIIASVRDASGKCVWSSADITFQVTGPADVFDTISVPRRAIAGKIAIILKSKNTSGTITITASAPGLMPATLTLASAPADNSSLPFIWPSSGITHSYADRITDKNISVRQTAQSIQVAFPSMDAAKSIVTLVNLQGKIIACPVQRKGFFVEVSTQSISRGFYFLRVTSNDEVVLKRVIVAK